MTQSQIVSNRNLDCHVRFAHIDGHTEFDFIPNNNNNNNNNRNHLVTIGSDCEVRLWSLDQENDQVQSSFTVDDQPYSIVANNDRIFLALADNTAKSFDYEEFGENELMICRFSSNATCLSFDLNRELLAIGAADFTIKVISLIGEQNSTKIFEGHEGPILSVSIDPLKRYLASSSCDGSVCLWLLDSKNVHHKWTKVISKSNDFENSPTLCRIAWEPQFGEFLAIPKENCVEIYKRGQWDNEPNCKISHPEMTGIFSIVSLSHDGQYIAASTIGPKSVIGIWRTDQISKNSSINSPIAMLFNGEKSITCLKFNPTKSNELCCTDLSGSLRIMNIQQKSLSNNNNNNNLEIKSNGKKAFSESFGEILEEFDMDDDFDDICLDDFQQKSSKIVEDQKTTSIKPVENKNSLKKKDNHNQLNRFSDLIDEQNVDIDIDNDINRQSNDISPVEVEEEFDISAIKSKYEPIIFADDNNITNDNSTSLKSNNFLLSKKISSENEFIQIDNYRLFGKDLLAACRGPRYQPPLRQQPFQSGSTPVHYQRRFMVWNSVGIVYSYQSTEENSIDVEFHDSTFHHSIHMVNMNNYFIADLTTSCLVLASNGDDDDDENVDYLDRQKPRLFCMLFNTWDQVKEWQIDLPKDENFDCLSASHKFIAALTTQRYLRIWTINGVQTMIRSIDGSAVNLSSYEDRLMILFHSASNHLEDGQSISCLVLKVDHKGKTRNHLIPTPIPVSLSPKSTVYWAGFSDEGTPCIVDSDGIIRLYKTHFGNGWFPICQTKKHANGRSDNFFIIGLSEIQSQVRCIFCKASRYPDPIPKPTLTVLPLEIPLCDIENSKAKYEEESLRNRWLISLLKRLSLDGYDVEDALEETEKQNINSLIKLFAIALGAERETLALDVAKLLPNPQALEGAVRYAERQRHRSLAMKLVEMVQEQQEIEEEENEPNSDIELQELMTKKDTDRLKQILKDTNKDSIDPISLPKYESSSNRNSNITLKPKSMKKSNGKNDDDNDETTSISLAARIESDSDENDDDDDTINQLRPKKMSIKSIVDRNQKNPFKILNKNGDKEDLSLKRKYIEESSDDEEERIVEDQPNDQENVNLNNDDNDNNDKSDESDNEPEITPEMFAKAFQCYFEANHNKLSEQFQKNNENNNENNDDDDDDEDQLLESFAKEKFLTFNEKQLNKWIKKAEKIEKQKQKKNKSTAKRTKLPSPSSSSSSTNKITNFFTKKN